MALFCWFRSPGLQLQQWHSFVVQWHSTKSWKVRNMISQKMTEDINSGGSSRSSSGRAAEGQNPISSKQEMIPIIPSWMELTLFYKKNPCLVCGLWTLLPCVFEAQPSPPPPCKKVAQKKSFIAVGRILFTAKRESSFCFFFAVRIKRL